MVHDINRSEHDEADSSSAQRSGEVDRAVAEVVGGEGDADDEEGAYDVRRHGVQVRFHSRVPEASDDLREEIRDGE